MTKRHIIIATRESPLALQQAQLVKQALIAIHPHISVELLPMTTEADRLLNLTLTEIGGKGLFLKELEEALIKEQADIAVHSVKDAPMMMMPDLILPVILKREDARDAFVSNDFTSLMQLPKGARVGTSSLRRQTQLRALRSDLTLINVRGNVNTRLNKLDTGEFDALILAAAGLKRLHLTERIRSYLSVEQVLPAAGQGALGIECRTNDTAIQALIAPLNDKITAACVLAERALCRQLESGCTLPVAAFAHLNHGVLHLEAVVANEAGTQILRAKSHGKPEDFENIGKVAAKSLIDAGALDILKAFHAP